VSAENFDMGDGISQYSFLARHLNCRIVNEGIKQQVVGRVQVDDFNSTDTIKQAYQIDTEFAKIFNYDHNDKSGKIKTITDETIDAVYEYFDKVDKVANKDGMTIVLTGGLYEDCLYKVFCAAIYAAVFKHNTTLHIVLPEQAITGGQDISTRDKYISFLQRFPVNSRYFIDGKARKPFLNEKDGELYTVIVSFMTTDAVHIKEKKQEYFDNIQKELRKSEYADLQDILRASNISEHLLPEIIRTLDTCATHEPLGSSKVVEGIKISKPQTVSFVIRCLKHLSAIRPFADVDALKSAIETLSGTITSAGILWNRRPAEGVEALEDLLFSKQILPYITSITEMQAVMESAAHASGKLWGRNLMHNVRIEKVKEFFADPRMSRFIASHQDIIDVLDGIGAISINTEVLLSTSLYDGLSNEKISLLVSDGADLGRFLTAFFNAMNDPNEIKEEDEYIEVIDALFGLLASDAIARQVNDLEDLIMIMNKLGKLCQEYEVACEEQNIVYSVLQGLLKNNEVTRHLGSIQDVAHAIEKVFAITKPDKQSDQYGHFEMLGGLRPKVNVGSDYRERCIHAMVAEVNLRRNTDSVHQVNENLYLRAA
jgi:hypothetical protein